MSQLHTLDKLIIVWDVVVHKGVEFEFYLNQFLFYKKKEVKLVDTRARDLVGQNHYTSAVFS